VLFILSVVSSNVYDSLCLPPNVNYYIKSPDTTDSVKSFLIHKIILERAARKG